MAQGKTVRFRVSSLLLLGLMMSAAQADPQAQPPPMSAYGQLPAMDEVSLSPNGNKTAFVAQSGDQRYLLVLNEKGELIVKSPINDVQFRELDWVGDDYLLAFVRSKLNDQFRWGLTGEFEDMAVFDLKTGKVTWPMSDFHYLSAVFGIFPAYQKDGKWLLPVVAESVDDNKTNEAAYKGSRQLAIVHLDSGRLERKAQPMTGIDSWLLDAHGHVVATDYYNSSSQTWTLFSDAAPKGVLAQQKDPLGGGWIIGQGETPGTIVYAQGTAEAGYRYLERALDGSGEIKELFPHVSHVGGWVVDGYDGHLTGAYIGAGESHLEALDPAANERVKAARQVFPSKRTKIVGFDNAFDKFIVLTDGAGDAGTYWLVNELKHKAQALGQRYPNVPPTFVGRRRWIDYSAQDGLALHGVLTLPPGRDPHNLPVVALPHGGPVAHDTAYFDYWAEAFASRGYAVWQPNFRGSDGYGNDLRKAGFGEWGRKMQTDISDGLKVLEDQGIVDPKRACIVGGSYGGYAALAGVILQRGLYRCAVSWGGVTDPRQILREVDDVREGRSPETARFYKRFFGAKGWNDDSIAEISPLEQAAAADAPILLMYGTEDTVVDPRQSQDLYKALRKGSAMVQLIKLDGENHWLTHAKTRTEMLQDSVDFVEKYNPPDPVPSAPSAQ